MRRLYYFISAVATAMLMSISAISQQVVNENFESYDAGTFIATEASSLWATWDEGSLGGLISEEQAHGGTKSMKVYKNGSTNTDVLILIWLAPNRATLNLARSVQIRLPPISNRKAFLQHEW